MRQRPTSNVIQDIEPCTVSKVLCPRLPRTSRCSFGRPMAVTEARNHACLQLLLQLACDVCSRWLVRGVDAERTFAGAWQRLWPYGGSEYVKAIDVCNGSSSGLVIACAESVRTMRIPASVSPPPCTRLWCCVCLLSTSQHSTKICA